MGALLALASALSYGLSDVVGGVLSRRISFVRVALLGQFGGLLFSLLVAPLAAGSPPTVPDLLWGGLSGVGTGTAMVFLFRGMSRGAMSVVVPVSAVGGVALPVLVSTLAFGDGRPRSPGWISRSPSPRSGRCLVDRPRPDCRRTSRFRTGSSPALVSPCSISPLPSAHRSRACGPSPREG